MKRILFIVAPVLLFLISGCEETFNPKTDFVEKYVLNCIVRSDTSIHIATVLKSYDVEGFDPYSNTESPFIANADVRLFYKNAAYFMTDTTTAGNDTSRYKGPVSFYYSNEFKPLPGDSIQITALLPNGRRLTSGTKVPANLTFNLTESDLSVPVEGESDFSVIWHSGGSGIWYFPKLILYYFKDVNGSDQRLSIEVPVNYTNNTPSYPEATRSNIYTFTNDALDKTMIKISEGDPDKSGYKILAAVFQIQVYDENLSKYYSSLNGYVDDFTVRVDEPDYSNIEGGFGIFGSYSVMKRSIQFSPEYVRSFGYIPVIDQ